MTLTLYRLALVSDDRESTIAVIETVSAPDAETAAFKLGWHVGIAFEQRGRETYLGSKTAAVVQEMEEDAWREVAELNLKAVTEP